MVVVALSVDEADASDAVPAVVVEADWVVVVVDWTTAT